jgi:hypothetical protein
MLPYVFLEYFLRGDGRLVAEALLSKYGVMWMKAGEVVLVRA